MADTIFGRSLQEARRVFNFTATGFPVNSSFTLIPLVMPTGMGKFRIERICWASNVVLNDADGTMLVTIHNRDISEGADDTLVNAQSVEGGTAHLTTDFTLVAETSEMERTLDEGDSVRVILTNNSAAIDTNGALTISIIGHPVPNYDSGPGVKHASQY